MYPHGALRIESPAGTIFVHPVGTERWSVQAYRPGDVTTAGTFMGHYPTREAAVAALELDWSPI
jgi:hypothetical protein